MSNYVSGNGGTVTNTTGTKSLNVTKWNAELKEVLAPNTHSGTNGATNYEPVVEDNSWDLECGWDSLNMVDTDVLLLPGAKVTLTLKIGSTAKTIILTGTTVESVKYICDNQGDIVRTTAQGRGGKCTHPVTG